MFVLSAIEEEIRVQPKDLCKTPLDAVTEVIQQRFLDKVVHNLGLVVTLYDVQSVEGGFVYPNDGAEFFKVKFRVVVFRPFVGEIITGRLCASAKDGLRASLEFFNDVIIPEHALQDPSFYNKAEKLWVWKFDGGCDVCVNVRVRVSCVCVCTCVCVHACSLFMHDSV
jgi:DNA-directed RNA polymerase III subunit RPC8